MSFRSTLRRGDASLLLSRCGLFLHHAASLECRDHLGGVRPEEEMSGHSALRSTVAHRGVFRIGELPHLGHRPCHPTETSTGKGRVTAGGRRLFGGGALSPSKGVSDIQSLARRTTSNSGRTRPLESVIAFGTRRSWVHIPHPDS